MKGKKRRPNNDNLSKFRLTLLTRDQRYEIKITRKKKKEKKLLSLRSNNLKSKDETKKKSKNIMLKKKT